MTLYITDSYNLKISKEIDFIEILMSRLNPEEVADLVSYEISNGRKVVCCLKNLDYLESIESLVGHQLWNHVTDFEITERDRVLVIEKVGDKEIYTLFTF